MTESLPTHDNVRYLQPVAYLYASVTFHFSFLYRGRSSANKEEVGEQGLVFVRELLWPLPNRREKHILVFSLRDGFILDKLLQKEEYTYMMYCENYGTPWRK